MFFAYCIILGRTQEEFWNARPSQVKFAINRYHKYKHSKQQEQEEVKEIHSMHEIAGWGCHGR